MAKKTEEEIKKAYGLARTMGRRFAHTHPRLVYHLDEDDYTQEAIVAWLEKKHIPFQLVDLYRRESPLSRRTWVKDKDSQKFYDPLNVDEMANALESDVDIEEDVEKLIRLKAIQKIVNDMVDPRQQMIIIMKYAYDKSLIEIAKALDLSRSYTSTLHREALKLIKEEIEDGD